MFPQVDAADKIWGLDLMLSRHKYPTIHYEHQASGYNTLWISKKAANDSEQLPVSITLRAAQKCCSFLFSFIRIGKFCFFRARHFEKLLHWWTNSHTYWTKSKLTSDERGWRQPAAGPGNAELKTQSWSLHTIWCQHVGVVPQTPSLMFAPVLSLKLTSHVFFQCYSLATLGGKKAVKWHISLVSALCNFSERVASQRCTSFSTHNSIARWVLFVFSTYVTTDKLSRTWDLYLPQSRCTHKLPAAPNCTKCQFLHKVAAVIRTDAHRMMAAAAMPGANQHIRSSLGFNILPKDTSTCRPGKIEPATFR